MGSSKTPDPVTPGEAAVAATGTAGAGEMMAMANQPVEQYGALTTQEELGPAQMQAQQALAARAALQGARAQQDIQSRVDPQAYAQRQMRMNSANQRLSRLYGVSPNVTFQGGESAYQMPGSADAPSLARLKQIADAISSNVSVAKVDNSGANPTLVKPRNPGNVDQNGVPIQQYSYL